MQNPKLIQVERGSIPRRLKKERRVRICIIIIALVLAVICKLIHAKVF